MSGRIRRKQLAEARTLFDWKSLKANYWQKRVTKEHGEEQKKVEWDIKPFTQNVVSVVYYLRSFTMKVGKKLAIQVADEGKMPCPRCSCRCGEALIEFPLLQR